MMNNKNNCREVEVVRGSGLKLGISLVEFEGNSIDLQKCFQGAEISAGGKTIKVPAAAAYTMDERRIAIAFDTAGLGFGPMEVRAKFNIPDRNFKDDVRVDILKEEPGVKIIG